MVRDQDAPVEDAHGAARRRHRRRDGDGALQRGPRRACGAYTHAAKYFSDETGHGRHVLYLILLGVAMFAVMSPARALPICTCSLACTCRRHARTHRARQTHHGLMVCFGTCTALVANASERRYSASPAGVVGCSRWGEMLCNLAGPV